MNPFPLSLFDKYIRSTVLTELQSVDANIGKFSDNKIVELLLHDIATFGTCQNHKILSYCVSFILKSERSDGSLLQEQMELDNNKTSDFHPDLICQSYKYS